MSTIDLTSFRQVEDRQDGFISYKLFGQIIVDSEEFLVVEVQQPWYRKVQG